MKLIDANILLYMINQDLAHHAKLRSWWETQLDGNLTSDAHLAAMAIGHGAVLTSCDRDFSGFPELRCENPLAN